MLFPGAIYIVIPVTFVILLFLCLITGIAFAAITYWTASFVINRHPTWRKIEAGYAIKWPWWVHKQVWFGLGWFWGFVIVLYVNCGPWWALMKHLGA